MDQRTRRSVSTFLTLTLTLMTALAARGQDGMASSGEEEPVGAAETVARVRVLEPLAWLEHRRAAIAAPLPAAGRQPVDAEPRADVPDVATTSTETARTETDADEESLYAKTQDPEREKVLAVVSSWVEAWSSQDAERYLSLYARSFRPANGLARQRWEEQRRQRLSAPSFIEIEVSSLGGPYELEPGRVMVSFRQKYTSDGYSDEVLKTLELIREDGEWKIFSEVSRPWR